MIRISLQWPAVVATTVFLYILVLITLPFSSVHATVFLFALIAFWSRLPGCGIVHPAWIISNLDLVDIFSIIISVNLGSLQGAGFVIAVNLWSRAVGVWPDWIGQLKDTGFMALLCFIIPLIWQLTGGSIVMTTFAFGIGRSILFIIAGIVIPHRSFGHQLVVEVQFQSSLLAVNYFYAKFFGNYFDNLLTQGVAFPWILFLGATLIIAVVYMSLYRTSKTGKGFLITLFHLLRRLRKRKKFQDKGMQDRRMEGREVLFEKDSPERDPMITYYLNQIEELYRSSNQEKRKEILKHLECIPKQSNGERGCI